MNYESSIGRQTPEIDDATNGVQRPVAPAVIVGVPTVTVSGLPDAPIGE